MLEENRTKTVSAMEITLARSPSSGKETEDKGEEKKPADKELAAKTSKPQ